MTDARKQSLYFPSDMLKEIKQAAIAQDRSLSWIVQRAWMIARQQILAIPAAVPAPLSQPSQKETAPAPAEAASCP